MKKGTSPAEPAAEVKQLPPLTPDQFKELMKAKGWKPEKLALRWGMSKRRVQQIAADAERPSYYDDALRGLPTYEEALLAA
ncbi:hypothetical protein [Pseudomonas sp.]|uniref:hypothetical protein n=1 Tax=Pseudomonas sp. TaxID=306 RepID=UPI00290D0D0B|nr:hypothetical protein [Pseudomonas sp.]MDU4254581.1 hypothetical protein [Pseudomonas sp.]